MQDGPYDYACEEREAMPQDRVVWVGGHAYAVDELPSPSELRE
jgi:hypothetical protein